MTYVSQGWMDGESGGTPITAARLLHIEQGVSDAHSLIVNLAPLVHSHTSADIVDATAAAVPDTVVKRDSAGRLAAADSTAPNEVATRGQLDMAVADIASDASSSQVRYGTNVDASALADGTVVIELPA